MSLGYLDAESLTAMCQVNQNFRNNICDDRLWRDKIVSEFGLDPVYIDLTRGKNSYWSYYKFLSMPIEEYRQWKQRKEMEKQSQNIQRNINSMKHKIERKKEAIDKFSEYGNMEKVQFHQGKLREMEARLKKWEAKARGERRPFQRGANVGFNAPIVMTDTLQNFFKHGNLGTVDPADPSSKPMGPILMATHIGIVTRAYVQKLLNYYSFVNQLQLEDDRRYMVANDEMKAYFQDTFDRLIQEGPRGIRGEVFDPDRFSYRSTIRIVQDNIIAPGRNTRDAYDERWVYLDGILIDRAREYYQKQATDARRMASRKTRK